MSSIEGSTLLVFCFFFVKLGLFCSKVTCSLYFSTIVCRVATLLSTVLVHGAHELSWFAEVCLIHH